MIKVSGDDIATAAQDALTAKKGFESKPGYCLRFVRQVIQSIYGNTFDAYWRPSAVESMEAFRRSPYALPVGTPLQRGDILFKGARTSGPNGHVAFVIWHGLIGENSSYHVNEARGDDEARGTRSIEAFGAYELVVRLSITAKKS